MGDFEFWILNWVWEDSQLFAKTNISNNFDLSINDLSCENDAWCIKMSIGYTFTLSCEIFDVYIQFSLS